MTKLSIVIVTYRCADELARCLNSIQQTRLVQRGIAEVVLVDNDSGDRTLEVAQAAPFPAITLALTENVGFGAGCNLGANLATGDQLLFLNPDTQVSDKTFEQLLAYLEEHPQVGCVGPAIVDLEEVSAPAARCFPTPLGEFARLWSRLARPLGLHTQEPQNARLGGAVDWVSGACMLVRRGAWEATGGFDEEFFLYYEETDWCRRAWNAGWQVHHDPSVHVLHVGGSSASRSGERIRAGQVARHFRASRAHYFRKHHGTLAALWVELLHATRALREGLNPKGAACSL